MPKATSRGVFPVISDIGSTIPYLRTDVVKRINGRDGKPAEPLYCGNEHDSLSVGDTEKSFMTYWKGNPGLFPDDEKPNIIVDSTYLGCLTEIGTYALGVRNNTLIIHHVPSEEPHEIVDEDGMNEVIEEPIFGRGKMNKESKRHLKGGEVYYMKLRGNSYEQDGVVMNNHKGRSGSYRSFSYPKFNLIVYRRSILVHDDIDITTLSVTGFAQTRKRFRERHLHNMLAHFEDDGIETYLIGSKYNQCSVNVEKTLIWDCIEKLDLTNSDKQNKVERQLLFDTLIERMPELRTRERQIGSMVARNGSVYFADAPRQTENGPKVTKMKKIFAYHVFILHKSSLNLPFHPDIDRVEFEKGMVLPELKPGRSVMLIADDFATIQLMIMALEDRRVSIQVFVLSASLEEQERLLGFERVVNVGIINTSDAVLNYLEDILEDDVSKPLVVCSGYHIPQLKDVPIIGSANIWTFGHYCPSVAIITKDAISLEAILKMFDSQDIHTKQKTTIYVLLEKMESSDAVRKLLDKYVSVSHTDNAVITEFPNWNETWLAKKLKELDFPLGFDTVRRIAKKLLSMESSRHLLPYSKIDEVYMTYMKSGFYWQLDESEMVTLVVESFEEFDQLKEHFVPPRSRDRPQCKMAVVTSLPPEESDRIKGIVSRMTKVKFDSVEVVFFKPGERLEEYFVKLGYEILPMNKIHTLLVLGSEALVPEELSLLNTDMTSLSNLKRDLFVDLRVEPERITVIGSEEECEEARKHIENHEVYSKAKDVHYFTYNRIWKMTYKDQLKKKGYVLEER